MMNAIVLTIEVLGNHRHGREFDTTDRDRLIAKKRDHQQHSEMRSWTPCLAGLLLVFAGGVLAVNEQGIEAAMLGEAEAAAPSNASTDGQQPVSSRSKRSSLGRRLADIPGRDELSLTVIDVLSQAVDADGIPNHYVPIDREQHGIKSSPADELEAVSLLQLESLPEKFDWRDVGKQSYVSVPRWIHGPHSLRLHPGSPWRRL